jgi:hypothetical protein
MKKLLKKLQVTSDKLQVTSYAFCFLLSAFCLLPSISFAQQPAKKIAVNKTVYYGATFGPTVDWFSPTSDSLTRSAVKGGFIGGATVDIDVSKEKFLYVSTGLFVRYLQGEVSFANQYFVHDVPSIENAVRTYKTTYLTLPTGIKFRTNPSKNCVFLGKIGLYHNFKIEGSQFDNFELDDEYLVMTKKIKNKDAALFAEAGYAGLGFEYVLGANRVFATVDYSCQFNYFSSKAKSNISNARFRSIVHSLQISFGFLF